MIFVSIASYRDPDLINTVKSCYSNALNKDDLFFSIFSQAEDLEHSDLSFIPESQIRYLKSSWQESLGACWAREKATQDIIGNYFLQIDSHSRFVKNWDKLIIDNFLNAQNFWGNRIILTSYPDPFELNEDGSDKLIDYPTLKKLQAFWDEGSKMIQSNSQWPDVVDINNGDEIYFLSANCLFSTSEIIKEIPYDKLLYFTGEEPSLAIRAYTRGIRLISPVVKFMYTNYNRPNSKRTLHWEDHSSWWELNKCSYERLQLIMTGDLTLGDYGIKSQLLFDQYQKITGINLLEKNFVI
ncbi:MAG: GlcNAc-transferase family protein [bacterium]